MPSPSTPSTRTSPLDPPRARRRLAYRTRHTSQTRRTTASFTISDDPGEDIIAARRAPAEKLLRPRTHLSTDVLSKIDRTILGRSPNGPLELRLSAVGPIRGLVFGAFGEISEEARSLLCYAADATAARTWVADGATSEEHAAALLKNRLYRRWGIKTART